MYKTWIWFFTIWTILFVYSVEVMADQTGDCTAGEQYCEQNSMETTSTTTTTNTNTNTNTNANTNANTNTNTNTNTTTTTSTGTNTNTNTNTNSNTNTNTSTSTATNNNTNSNTNTSTSTSNATNSNTNVNTSTSTATNNNVNTNNSTSNVTSTNSSTSTNTNNNMSTSTSTSSNTNTNVNQSTSENKNTNVNQSTSESNVTTDNTNTNVNQSTSNNTNKNINESKSEQTINQNIKTEAPPASAIAPSIMSYSQDLCTVGRSGAFQGQVFGLSAGRTVRDENCERLKLSKYLYDTGMKVAAVGILCQDPRVFKAMQMAGTPCPYFGKIGEEARLAWASNPKDRPDYKEAKDSYVSKCRGTLNEAALRKSRGTCVREFNKGT